MSNLLTSEHNRLEPLVYQAVQYHAARYPTVADDEGLLADVARIALNHLPARDSRHPIDLSFHGTGDDRARQSQMIHSAVLWAFDYVYARTASSARHLVRNLNAGFEAQASSGMSYL